MTSFDLVMDQVIVTRAAGLFSARGFLIINYSNKNTFINDMQFILPVPQLHVNKYPRQALQVFKD